MKMTAPHESSGEKKRIQAVQTTIDIIDALQEHGDSGVTEISKQIGVTKGTVHNHLATLEENDFVYKDGNDRYHLGLRFIDVAHHAKLRIPILELARTEVDKLAETTGEMALFTVEEHGLGVCLYVAYGEEAVQTWLYVGQRSGLHHTAVGKALLASLPDERVEKIIEERGLTQVTPNTITEKSELFEELDEVREDGIAFNHQETIQGLVGVGAPIKSQSGDLLGALSIVGPASRMGEERLQEELPDLIMQSVNVIEVNATSL